MKSTAFVPDLVLKCPLRFFSHHNGHGIPSGNIKIKTNVCLDVFIESSALPSKLVWKKERTFSTLQYIQDKKR